MDRYPQTTALSRRTFLTTTSAALVGAALGGLASQSAAAPRHPQRRGVLQYGARLDPAGLDSHRINQLHTGHATAAMYTGLTDIDYKGNVVPGIAESWEPNKELTAWVFRLRKGVLFHNGREVDAEAVKLNILRIKNPAIGSDWHRGAVDTIESVDVLDKYTVRINASVPDVTLPSSVMHYPTNLQAPDNFDRDAVAYADIERFQKSAGDKYNLWRWHSGGIFVAFNWRRGPFQDKRLRTAAAHAIDRQAIHNSVFYGQGDMLDQPFPRGNPWHLESRSLEYDPDKAKTLLKQARAVGTALKIVCSSLTATARECGQIVQEHWNSIGFKVTLEPLDTVPFLNARKQGEFDGLINGHTFRFDPDDFFGRNLHSKSEYAQVLSGWQNARCDQLLEEAKRTLDPARRKELYTEVWNINNVELAQFQLHEVTQTSAAVKEVRDYQPNAVGALTYRGGGFRTAYIGA